VSAEGAGLASGDWCGIVLKLFCTQLAFGHLQVASSLDWLGFIAFTFPGVELLAEMKVFVQTSHGYVSLHAAVSLH
jgi:hypothetical protein